MVVPAARLIIAMNHLPELVGTESHAGADAGGERFTQQTSWQPIVVGAPTLANIE